MTTDKPCEYCDPSTYAVFPHNGYSPACLDRDMDQTWLLCVTPNDPDYNHPDVYVRVTHCPMCGRKLAP